MDHLRLENLTENEETVIELKRIHDHDKMLLLEDNKRLVSELDKVSFYFLHIPNFCSRSIKLSSTNELNILI